MSLQEWALTFASGVAMIGFILLVEAAAMTRIRREWKRRGLS